MLFLYPLDLSAVEERFGSWMVQYGYANYISAEKLLQNGRVENGRMLVKGSAYRAVCMLFEPFPAPELIALLTDFVHGGGTLVWSGIPPQTPAAEPFLAQLFGLRLLQAGRGQALPGRQVTFGGALAPVQAMSILTDFTVDRVYPLALLEGTEAVAFLRPGGASAALTVGGRKTFAGGGQAVCLGFRPRDDQSASTGQEVRTWFEILAALGVHAGSDDAVTVSRTGEVLACAFPNGALALAPHYRTHAESWPGGFFRDAEKDRLALADNPVPGDAIQLDGLRLNGQTVSYQGRALRQLAAGRGTHLRAFAGLECSGITINGQSWRWSDAPVDLAWHPLGAQFAAGEGTPLYRLWCGSEGARVRFPLELAGGELELWLGRPPRWAGAPGARCAKAARGWGPGWSASPSRWRAARSW